MGTGELDLVVELLPPGDIKIATLPPRIGRNYPPELGHNPLET